MSNCLLCHGLYSPWNSLGHITGVGSCYLSRDPSQPRDWTQVSWIAGGFFTVWATKETQSIIWEFKYKKGCQVRWSLSVFKFFHQEEILFFCLTTEIFFSLYLKVLVFDYPSWKNLGFWSFQTLGILREYQLWRWTTRESTIWILT